MFAHITNKRLELKKKFILNHDTPCSHTSTKTMVFLIKLGIKVMEHLHYGPDLTQCNFWHFLCLKFILYGLRFNTNEAVAVEANSHFNSIDSNEFAKAWVK